jgi:cell division protein FtsB
MRWLIVALLIILFSLQYRLWISEGSFPHRASLQEKIELQKAENNRLKERNTVLALEVDALKSGLEVIEERAREQMGMIKEGETFFMIVDPEQRQANE